MNLLLRSAAYIFHPLLMPVFAVLLYYFITPRYIEPQIFSSKLLAVIIVTLLIPIVFYFLLKNLKVISSIHLREVKERKVPLMIQCILYLLIIKMVFDPYDNPELYYFFVGVLFSTMTCMMMVFFGFKVSLHQVGIAGVTMFVIALSIHFKVNLLLLISIHILANGWIATSRLHTHSHNLSEITTGLFVGVIPQILMLNFWL